ncbi:MAG TPA: hypothetical protein VFS00_31750, partial [Polyangiaceae bacterium]|nr:hypothetical protein [Polyangiaceae bacterium]
DGGATSAWVPFASVRPLGGGASAGAPPVPPTPPAWGAYPAYSGGRAASTPAPTPAAGASAAQASATPGAAGGQPMLSPLATSGSYAASAASAPPGSHVASAGPSALPGSHAAPAAPHPLPGSHAPPATPPALSGSHAPLAAPSALPGGHAAPSVASAPSGGHRVPSVLVDASDATLPGSEGGPLAPPSVREVAPTLDLESGPPPRPMAGTIAGLPRGLVYEATGAGPGSGQAFFVFFGFVAGADGDAARRLNDLEHLGDDVAALRAAGFRVVVDLHGDLEGLNAALCGTHPDAEGAAAAGVFWGCHGEEDGTIEDCEGFRIAPEQVAPEAARRGACTLFVMSAHGAGRQDERWQKALGPQAAIVARGAPARDDRASDFLTPDDASSKDFDDLLERHLGARRVGPDGPLVEASDLARRHDERPAAPPLAFDELVAAAHRRLACPLQRGKRGEAYFTVRTPPTPERPDAPRAQIVRAAPVGPADSFLLVSSLVGPHSGALDLARGLRAISPALHLRLALARITPPDQDFVVVETLFRRRPDPTALARNVRAVGAYADRLEAIFFGRDQR